MLSCYTAASSVSPCVARANRLSVLRPRARRALPRMATGLAPPVAPGALVSSRLPLFRVTREQGARPRHTDALPVPWRGLRDEVLCGNWGTRPRRFPRCLTRHLRAGQHGGLLRTAIRQFQQMAQSNHSIHMSLRPLSTQMPLPEHPFDKRTPPPSIYGDAEFRQVWLGLVLRIPRELSPRTQRQEATFGPRRCLEATLFARQRLGPTCGAGSDPGSQSLPIRLSTYEMFIIRRSKRLGECVRIVLQAVGRRALTNG